MNRSTLLLFLSLCAATHALAGPERPKSQVEKQSLSDSFVFQLLPNSLSKNPRLEMSFITEMTVDGHKLSPPTPAAPAYYISQQGGYRQLGHSSYAGDHTPPPEAVQRLMQEALGKAGYLPADAGHPATLVVIFHWGSYPALASARGDRTPSAGPKNHQLIERAVLVGGEKFAQELKEAIAEAASLKGSSLPRSHYVDLDRQGYVNFGTRSARVSDHQSLHSMAQSGFGSANGILDQAFNPLQVFLRKSRANEGLFDLAAFGCYYVVASAYDAGAAAQKQKVLLWRTKMCSADDGVSLKDAMTPLIKRSARYLGRETDGAVNISRRMHEGKVELGETKIMGEVENPSP